MTYCHVSRQIDRHVSILDDAEDRDEAIMDRADELMLPGGKFCPTDKVNIDEAVSELIAEPKTAEKFCLDLQNAADISDEALGKTVRAYLHHYWLHLAKDQAEMDLDEEIKQRRIDDGEARYERRCMNFCDQ